MAAKKMTARKTAATLGASPLPLEGIAVHGAFEQVAVDARARLVVTAQRDRGVRAHDVRAGTERLLGRHTRRVQALHIDPGARWAVSAGGDTIVWSLEPGGRPRTVAGLSGVMSVSASDRGVFVVAGSGGVALIDASAARVSRTLQPFDGLAATSAVAAGGRVFAGSEAGDVVCAEAKSGRVVWSRSLGTYPVKVALDDARERLIAVMSAPVVLSAATGAELKRPRSSLSAKGGVLCTGVLGEDVLTGGYDGTLRVWNLKTNAVSRIGKFKYAVMSLATASKARVVVAISGRELQGCALE